MIERIIAFLLFLILFIPIIVCVAIATLDTRQFGLFSQKRVGKKGVLFSIYKLRTLKGSYNSSITNPSMQKSKIGVFFRKYHIDEVPQIINILIGNMSFVGARPDVEKYYNQLSKEDFEKLTAYKPGITGIVQLEYFNEEMLINQQRNPEEYYQNVLWPKKVQMNIEYNKIRTWKSDIMILYKTFQKLIQQP